MKKDLYHRLYQKMAYYMALDAPDSCHDKSHVLRVIQMALHLSEDYQEADLDVLLAAALLHDIGRSDKAKGRDAIGGHADIGAKMAYDILLQEGFDPEKAAHVRDAIKSHSLSKGIAPKTIEAKLLFDADKLDLTGAMGIARTFLYGGLSGEPIYQTDEDEKLVTEGKNIGPSYIKQHHNRLKKTAGQLYTPKAKAIALEREMAADYFYETLLADVTRLWEQGMPLLNLILED